MDLTRIGSTAVRAIALVGVAWLWLCIGTYASAQSDAASLLDAPLTIERVAEDDTGAEVLHGTYAVLENRQAPHGRIIKLNLVVLRASGPEPRPDPIFFLAGGPGQAATDFAGHFRHHWMRRDRDIVLVDQRGTGRSNPLDCSFLDDDEDIQAMLNGEFQLELLTECIDELGQVADLTQYTTPIAMDDLDDLRAALGYEKINLIAGSYGTRAALVYMRRHTGHVRSAVLNAVAPLPFISQLHAVRSGQTALDRVFADCAADPTCRKAFPDLDKEFQVVLDRLREEPVDITVTSPWSGEPVQIRLSHEVFGMTLLLMMYSHATLRDVPMIIHGAFDGDYSPIAQFAVSVIPALYDSLNMGMLLCVVCSEEAPRIDEAAIAREIDGTFIGDGQIRQLLLACAHWPRGEIAADYGEPVSCDTPTLIFSGTHDPATSPRWGEEAARHLPNSLHVVVPGTHHVSVPCVDAITGQFLSAASVDGLDTSCVADVEAPSYRVPE
jgi:pimeloyl-ACP methyl ester carboxylesterase